MKLNLDYFCVHTGIDEQMKGKDPLRELKGISKLKLKVEVAGGINPKIIKQIVELKPEIIVVGAITKSKNPEQVAKKIFPDWTGKKRNDGQRVRNAGV